MATKKIKMVNPRGNPTDKNKKTGQAVMLARGATVELADFWADRFIADGDATEVKKREKSEEK